MQPSKTLKLNGSAFISLLELEISDILAKQVQASFLEVKGVNEKAGRTIFPFNYANLCLYIFNRLGYFG
jgi:hypothetical protein